MSHDFAWSRCGQKELERDLPTCSAERVQRVFQSTADGPAELSKVSRGLGAKPILVVASNNFRLLQQ